MPLVSAGVWYDDQPVARPLPRAYPRYARFDLGRIHPTNEDPDSGLAWLGQSHRGSNREPPRGRGWAGPATLAATGLVLTTAEEAVAGHPGSFRRPPDRQQPRRATHSDPDDYRDTRGWDHVQPARGQRPARRGDAPEALRLTPVWIGDDQQVLGSWRSYSVGPVAQPQTPRRAAESLPPLAYTLDVALFVATAGQSVRGAPSPRRTGSSASEEEGPFWYALDALVQVQSAAWSASPAPRVLVPQGRGRAPAPADPWTAFMGSPGDDPSHWQGAIAAPRRQHHGRGGHAEIDYPPWYRVVSIVVSGPYLIVDGEVYQPGAQDGEVV